MCILPITQATVVPKRYIHLEFCMKRVNHLAPLLPTNLVFCNHLLHLHLGLYRLFLFVHSMAIYLF